MKRITGFYFICTFLCGIFSFKINASQFNFNKVDSIFESDDLLGAVVECERISYFAESQEIKTFACLKQIDCYKKSGDFKKAKEVAMSFNIPYMLPKNLQFELRFQAALCAHLAEDFKDAELQLAFIDAGGFDSTLLKKTYLLKAFNAIEMNDFMESKKWMEKEVESCNISPYRKDSLLMELESLFSKKELPKSKSENIAFWLGLVPGLGHAYAGEYKEGAVAFLLNLSALSFGAYEIYKGFYLTGYFTGAGLLVKFYYGSRDRMDYLIEKRNFKEIRGFKRKVGDFAGMAYEK